MNKFVKYCFLVAMLIISSAACKKDGDTKISPPDWIIGEWEWSYENETYHALINYKFTSNDIISTSSYSDSDPPVSITYSEINKSKYMQIKENVKTDEIYEVTIMTKESGKWNSDYVRHFQKGDGTYIEVSDDNPVSTKLTKI